MLSPNVVEILKEGGVPKGYISEDLFHSLPGSLQDKFQKAVALIENGYKKIILVGKESEYKDKFASALLIWIVTNFNKTGHYYVTPSGMSNEQAYATAIMGIDLITMRSDIQNLSTFVRDVITKDRIIILGCNTTETLEAAFGDIFMDYLSHRAVRVDVSVEREEILDI